MVHGASEIFLYTDGQTHGWTVKKRQKIAVILPWSNKDTALYIM